MKKLLPINISNNFYTECWTYFRFSIIEAYEQLKHWKYFNINYLYTDNIGNLFLGKSGEIYSPIYSYTEILNITGYLHSDISSNDFYHFYFYIKNLIKESITIKNNVSYTNGYFTYYEKLIFAGECIIAGSDSYYEKDYNYTTNIKKLLSFRLNLYEYISFADSKYLLNESKHLNETMKLKISDMLNKCSNLSIKYMFSKKIACLEKIISILNECIILERRFFNELNLSLEKYCRDNY